MRTLLSTILLGALACAGCAHKKPDGFSTQGFSQLPPAPGPRPTLPVSPQEVIVTPEPARPGKVVKVNGAGHFVVLNFPIGHLPAVEQQLNVYHLGLKVGEIKISGPQQDDNIIGDLVRGTAEIGDEAREQ
jgi:hypothetical protein